MANSKAWKPYSYLDESGQPKGILVDLWDAYGSANNVKVEYQLVDWGESIRLVREGKADVHAGLLWSQERSSFYSYGPAIASIDTQLYFNNKISAVDPVQVLSGQEPYAVGVVADSYEVEFINAQYPNAKLREFDNNQLMLEAAFRGDIQVFAADLLVANYYIHAASQQTDFFPAKLLYSGELHFAVAHGNEALLTDIAGQFTKVKQGERDRILAKWTHIETVYPKYLVASLISVTFIVLIGYVVTLRLAVKAKTQQLAKANQELTLLAKTDALTGLFNRRSYFEYLDTHRGCHTVFTVMVLDIDDFKKINDTHGHIVGDNVISAISNAIGVMLKRDEMFSRIGGEEFAISFVGGSAQASFKMAEDIVTKVANTKVEQLGDQPITISLGCAVYVNGYNEINLAEADKLMYQAKSTGKNCSVSKAISTR